MHTSLSLAPWAPETPSSVPPPSLCPGRSAAWPGKVFFRMSCHWHPSSGLHPTRSGPFPATISKTSSPLPHYLVFFIALTTSLFKKLLVFFYLPSPECIRDLAVLYTVMSLVWITAPGIQEYSWSRRMKEFIFKTKTQLMCKVVLAFMWMVYNDKMRTLYENLKQQQSLFSSVCYIMLTSAVTWRL